MHLTFFSFFFFNDTATTEIYTLSLHDALPISPPATNCSPPRRQGQAASASAPAPTTTSSTTDRKSTRLNSSHGYISYAVFCLKKKKREIEIAHELLLIRSRNKTSPLS